MKQTKNEEMRSPLEVAAKVAKLKADAYKALLWSIIGIAVALLAAFLFSGCASTKYVPMPEVHEEHHWHTDSVHKTDSVYHEKETTIMQLDSAEMARYGIQLKSAERAWLVKTAELQRQIERLEAMSATKDSVHDSIPYPVEVIKEVPAQVTGWRMWLIRIGYGAVLLTIGLACWLLGGILAKIKKNLL